MATAAEADFFGTDTPHGYVKREMWYEYLQKFIAKTQQSRSGNMKTIICDVFAGPGLYENSNGWSSNYTNYGSPLVTIRAAIEYFVWKNKLSNTFIIPGVPANVDPSGIPGSCAPFPLTTQDYKIELYFVEKDRKNYESLIKNIISFFNFHNIRVNSSHTPNQACVSSIDQSFSILCNIFNCEFIEFQAPFVPYNARMVTFIDPFGYAMIPWQKVSEFVGQYKELFINLMTSFMHRFFMQNRDKIGEVFGIDPMILEDKRNGDPSGNFVDTLVDLYVEMLNSHFRGLYLNHYALTFEVRNKGNVRLYHLIFASSHIEGLKSMKEAFNRGTQNPLTFALSDFMILRKNIPLNLGNNQDPTQVANVIFQNFKGRSLVSIKEIERFVWRDTPYVYRKTPLAILEREGKIVSVVDCYGNDSRHCRFTFPNYAEWFISFALV